MADAVELVIAPRPSDIGGFEVRRALPYAKRRTVGPFIFFDHMGPASFPAGQGIDVRPHPHIGLATVTYLFQGEIHHRDSLGLHQPIRPGDVNWMTAGRGIVHSERTGPEERARDTVLDGIQSWLALPLAHEEAEPAFHHHPAATLPAMRESGVTMRLITGTAFGEHSPVAVYSAMFYLDVEAAEGATVPLPDDHEERALYVAHGRASVDGRSVETGEMAVFAPGTSPALKAETAARVMLLGGESTEGRRFIWWNFVSSSEDRIEQAKRDWKEGRFDPVPGETEFIPLPEG